MLARVAGERCRRRPRRPALRPGAGRSRWSRCRRRPRRGVPASRSRRCPASSSASQATSRRSRCCGSIRTASRGEMPKKSASNRSTSLEEPAREAGLPTARRDLGRSSDPPAGRRRRRRRRRGGAARTPRARRRRGSGSRCRRSAIGSRCRAATSRRRGRAVVPIRTRRRGTGQWPRWSGARRRGSARAAGPAIAPARRPVLAAWNEPRPKLASERLRGSTLDGCRRRASLASLARNQSRIAAFAATGSTVGARSPGMRPCSGPSPRLSGHEATDSSVPARNAVAAGVALDLAAGGLGQAHAP